MINFIILFIIISKLTISQIPKIAVRNSSFPSSTLVTTPDAKHSHTIPCPPLGCLPLFFSFRPVSGVVVLGNFNFTVSHVLNFVNLVVFSIAEIVYSAQFNIITV